MRRPSLRDVTWVAVAAAALGAAACGGSSSETPWPVEPENLQRLGPAGEAPPGTTIELDAGAPEKPTKPGQASPLR